MPATRAGESHDQKILWHYPPTYGNIFSIFGFFIILTHGTLGLSSTILAWAKPNFMTPEGVKVLYVIMGALEATLIILASFTAHVHHSGSARSFAVAVRIVKAALPGIVLSGTALIAIPVALPATPGKGGSLLISICGLLTAPLIWLTFWRIISLTKELDKNIRYPHGSTRKLTIEEDSYRRERFGKSLDLPSSIQNYYTARQYAVSASNESFTLKVFGNFITLISGSSLLVWGVRYFESANPGRSIEIWVLVMSAMSFIGGIWMTSCASRLQDICDEYWHRCSELAATSHLKASRP